MELTTEEKIIIKEALKQLYGIYWCSGIIGEQRRKQIKKIIKKIKDADKGVSLMEYQCVPA